MCALMRLYVAVILLTALSIFARAEAGEVLKFGYFPFNAYEANDGSHVDGPILQLVKKLAQESGYELEFVKLPNKRLRTALARGEIDFSIITNRYEEFHNNHAVWSENPFYYIQLAAFSRDPDVIIQKPEDLKYKSVVVRRGYDYVGWRHFIDDVQNKVEIAGIVDTTEQALKVLTLREQDVLLEYVGDVEVARKALNLEPIPYSPLTRMPFHLVVSSILPHAKKVLTDFETAFHALQVAGHIDEDGNIYKVYSQK